MEHIQCGNVFFFFCKMYAWLISTQMEKKKCRKIAFELERFAESTEKGEQIYPSYLVSYDFKRHAYRITFVHMIQPICIRWYFVFETIFFVCDICKIRILYTQMWIWSSEFNRNRICSAYVETYVERGNVRQYFHVKWLWIDVFYCRNQTKNI